MPIHDLRDQIVRLPEQPGVYLFFNRRGDTVYVGKARALRDRVRSYLGAAGASPRHDALLADIARLEVVVTDSVVEALALENNLIKQRAPKYNILLRDDKNYPFLRLTVTEPFPRVVVARGVERGGDVYAGPFLPARLGRRTMELTHRLFGIRSCNETITGRRGRPCLEYDIHRCLAPCVERLCSPAQYQQAVAETKLFLEGRNDELLDELRRRMTAAAEGERFEEAAQLRDAIRTVQALHDRQQKMATTGLGDRDAFGLTVGPAGSVILVFQMRGGRIIDRVELGAESFAGVAEGEAAVLQAAVQQFYDDREPPPEIHLPVAIDDPEPLGEWLSARAGRKVRLLVPKRGDKRGLVDLATRNAELAYRTRFDQAQAAHDDALETLRAVLHLPATPRRIECFDISTIQGSETVASMVVCENGTMRPGEYRKFRVRGDRGTGLVTATTRDTRNTRDTKHTKHTTDDPRPTTHDLRPTTYDLRPTTYVLDDFAAMHEVVLRRYRTAVEAGGPFPDLVVIDGGKGQLSAAYEALEAIGCANLVAVGLAKKEELVFTRDRAEPIALAVDDPALLLLQRIRDEAHRFAVTFHRKARSMRDLRSVLDDVPGIGPRRRKALLTAFGSLAGVRRATREDLARIVGAKAAAAVIDHFARM